MRSKPTLMKFCALALAALMITIASPAPRSFAQATTVTTTESVPFSGTVPNICNGEAVAFNGNLNIVNHVSTDASGGTHVRTHVNYQGVSGTGLTSGAAYRVTSTINEVLNDNDGPQSSVTVVQSVNVIAQGPLPNFLMRVVFHVTINANGQTTTIVDNARVECRG